MRPALLLLPLLLALAAWTPGASAMTRPDIVKALLEAKAVLSKRGPGWTAATANWVCDGPPGGPGCDPCGTPSPDDDWWSAWDHIACRGPNAYLDDIPRGGTDGRVSNIHFVTMANYGGGVDGPDAASIVDALCPLGTIGVSEGLPSAILEFDLTSSQRNAEPQRRISGAIPPKFATCFPRVHQMEWSYNALNGTLPAWVAGEGSLPNLGYFKMRANRFTGPIPPAYGTIPALFRLDLGRNGLTGPIPTTFRDHPALGIFQIDGNAGLSGDLLGLVGTHLQVAMVSPNPGLCGPVPASVRFAVGFNTSGTALGKPCPPRVGLPEPLAGEEEGGRGAGVAVMGPPDPMPPAVGPAGAPLAAGVGGPPPAQAPPAVAAQQGPAEAPPVAPAPAAASGEL